jgi:hypothetical protein
MTGGFARRLDVGLVTRYRDDWLRVVDMRRAADSLKDRNTGHLELQWQVNTLASKSSATEKLVQPSNVRTPESIDAAQTTRQIFRLADEIRKHTELILKITTATSLLAGITDEHTGAIKRFALKTRVARSPAEASKARDDLAEELVPIVTQYSRQAYSIRRLENEEHEGVKTQLDIIASIPRDEWDATILNSIRQIKRNNVRCLQRLESLQKTHDSTYTLKGKSPRVDDALDHMLDAMTQMLNNRGLFDALQQKLHAFDL